MAHTKALGSTRNLRDSEAKRLGVKRQHGEAVKAGEILIRQRGAKYLAGKHVGHGSDDTLYALKAGVVQFASRKKTRFDGSTRYAKMISIQPTAHS